MTCANCGLVRLEGSALETNRSDYLGDDEENIFPADRDRDFGKWAEFRLGQLLELHPAVERLAEVGSGTGHFLEAAAKRWIPACLPCRKSSAMAVSWKRCGEVKEPPVRAVISALR